MSCCITKSSSVVDVDMPSLVELTVAGAAALERGCNDCRRGVVVAGVFVTAALDGVNV